MGINVQFDSYEEMVEFANKISGGVKQEAPVKKDKPGKPVKDIVTEVTTTTVETTLEETEEIEKVEETTEAVTFTLEQVRAKLTELTRAGKQKEVKKIITDFGAKNVTSILPDHYAALMEKAGEL